MPYITLPEYTNAPGRQYRYASTDPKSGAISCEVDEVLDGEIEISVAAFAAASAANAAHTVALPHAPDQPPAKPTVEEQLADLRAMVERLSAAK